MDVVAERQFNTLKKRLDALQYCQPLSLDSAALVERLLNDLLKTTEGFQTLKKQNKSLEEKQMQQESIMEPLKRQNNQLIIANNDLNLEIMRLREELDKTNNELRLAVKTSQGQAEDITGATTKDLLAETQALQTQVTNRDREIQRLCRLLEDSPDIEKLSSRYAVQEQKDSELSTENEALREELAVVSGKLDRCGDLIDENRELQVQVLSLTESNAGLKTNVQHLKEVVKQLEDQHKDKNERSQDLMSNELTKAKVSFHSLRKTLDNVQLENLKLQEDIRNSERVCAQFIAEKQSFHANMQRLTSEKAKQRNDMLELSSTCGKLEGELKTAQEELAIARQQLVTMKREIELGQSNMNKINKENQSSSELALSAQQKFRDAESQKILLENEIQNLRFELDRAQKMKLTAEHRLDQIKTDTYKAKTAIDSNAAEAQQIKILYEEAQKEIEMMKQENANLTRQRETDRRTIYDLERNALDSETQIAAANQEVQKIQREQSAGSEEVQRKRDEIRQLESQRLQLEREVEELRPLRGQLDENTNEISCLKEDFSKKDIEATRKERLIEDLEQHVRNLNTDNANLSAKMNRVNEENVILAQKLETLENEHELLNVSKMRSEAQFGELEQIKDELLRSRNKERELLREIEQCKGEIARMTDKVTSAKRQLEHADKQKIELAAELDKSRVDFSATQAKETERKSYVIKIEDQLFQSNLQIEDLQRQLNADKTQRNRLDDQILQLKRSLESEKTHSERLNEQINHLKSLIEDLEKVRDDLLVKIQSNNANRSMEETQRTNLIAQVSDLRSELHRKNSELNDLNESMRNLDSDRNYVTHLLDQKEEQLAAVASTVGGKHEQLADMKSQLASLQLTDDANLRKLDERESTIASLNEKVKVLSDSLDEQRGNNTQMYKENIELNDNVNALTRENKKVNDEMLRVMQEKDKLQAMYDTLANSELMAQQAVKNIEREKDCLQERYQKACEEKELAASNISSMSQEQKAYLQKLNNCEQELISAQDHNQRLEGHIRNCEAKIQALECNVSDLTREVEHAERRVLDAKDDYARDINATRQLTIGLETTNEGMQRRMAMTENERMLSETRSKKLESEVRALTQNLQIEKTRNQDLEAALGNYRENTYALQNVSQKFSTTSSPDRYDLEKKLDENRNEILNLEMEQMRLREENGKTKHLLFKSESRVAELES